MLRLSPGGADEKEQFVAGEDNMALTAKQKKLPKALQKAILAKQKKGKGKKKGMKNGKKKARRR